jgi:hypothetical protein
MLANQQVKILRSLTRMTPSLSRRGIAVMVRRRSAWRRAKHLTLGSIPVDKAVRLDFQRHAASKFAMQFKVHNIETKKYSSGLIIRYHNNQRATPVIDMSMKTFFEITESKMSRS